MKSALLIQPPIYDTQYWPEWSMPSGLLKVSSWLRKLGYDLRLVDCLFPDEKGEVKQEYRKVVQVCSTLEWSMDDYREMGRERFKKSTIELPQHHRYKYEFGLPLREVEKHLRGLAEGSLFSTKWVPDEVWITSIMTYWWESTADTVDLVRRILPSARIRIGGIYPTLAPHHLKSALAARGHEFEIVRGRDLDVRTESSGEVVVANSHCIVTGEIPGASNEDLDFKVYERMTLEMQDALRVPKYAILITSRGCPFDCGYCAQKAYNEGSLKVRIRSARDTFNEIKDKYVNHGVHDFAFYEDNFLLEKPNIEALLRLLIQHRNELPHVRLYAPEGMEVRLLHQDLAFAKLMKESGFESVYLPLETMSRDVTKAWNRRHSNAGLFEKAVKICHDANFKLHDMEVNAFILFGMPDENLQDIVNTILYASEWVGGLVPMLFTPVPGSLMFEQFEEYLLGEMGFDLHHLNGKLYPFLKYNSERRGIRLEDYVALESLAFRLNAKSKGQTFQLAAGNEVYRALRRVLAGQDRLDCPEPVAEEPMPSPSVGMVLP